MSKSSIKIHGCDPIRGTRPDDAKSIDPAHVAEAFEYPKPWGLPARAVAWSRQRDQGLYALVAEWDFTNGDVARRIEFWTDARGKWRQRTTKTCAAGGSHSSMTFARVLS